MMELLRPQGPHPAGLVLHAYAGPAELVPELTRLGAYFSFGGGVTYPRNRRIRSAAAAVPEDRLLAETDAPDMLPYPCRAGGEETPNEPANLVHAVRALAEVRGVSEDAMAGLTWENGQRVFARVTGGARGS
jgi:TatD DNase family protein